MDDAIAQVGPAATTVLPVPDAEAPGTALQAQRELYGAPVVQRSGGGDGVPYHPEGGVVGSVQFCYDWMTGDVQVVGWIWAGAGYKTPIGWYGAYVFGELDMTVANIGALLTAGVCASDHDAGPDHSRVEAHGGGGVAPFPVVVTPGERARFSKGGLEIGLLLTVHPADRSADLEVIGLVDVKKYLGPFGAAAAAAEAAAQRIGQEFGQRVECGAGFDISASAHLCRAADPSSGLLGYTTNSLKLCGGGFIGCNINLSRNRGELPGGGH